MHFRRKLCEKHLLITAATRPLHGAAKSASITATHAKPVRPLRGRQVGALGGGLAEEGGIQTRRFARAFPLRRRARQSHYRRGQARTDRVARDSAAWKAAVALAERGSAETEGKAKRTIAAVMRTVGAELGNTPAVARNSYVSPAVIDQYLDATTIEDFRPRHLRVVGARDLGLDREEQALLSLLRSWRIKQSRAAA